MPAETIRDEVRETLEVAGAEVDGAGNVTMTVSNLRNVDVAGGEPQRRAATDAHRDYHTALTVEKVSLTTKRMRDTEGSAYEVPQLQVLLSITDESAAEIGAAFCAFQGREVAVAISGEARQLSLF